MAGLLQNTVFGRSKSKPFVSTWNTVNTSTGSSTSTQAKLPLVSSGTYAFTVDWGDGTSNYISTYNQAEVTHTYSVSGTYTISIKGICTGWQFNNTGDKLKILSVTTWGGLKLGSTAAQFQGCTNLNLTAVTDLLNLTGATDISNMFIGYAFSTINRINEWNTSSVINMTAVFQTCTLFNQDLSGWNTSNVTVMSSMFQSAVAFNQNLGSWNVSKVTSFNTMFFGATNFNNGGSSDINNWVLKTTGTINMNGMFGGASSFNQPIGNWNTVAVNSMATMFQGATAFNQNLGAWNVSKVTAFNSMFSGATAFNNGGVADINNWVLSSTSGIVMNNMFQSATSFNQPINNWNTGMVSTTSFMFYLATGFNQPLNSWNFSSVTNTSSMFQGASAFNQNVGAWNVSAVTNFGGMFSQTTNFNNGGLPDINNWTLKTTGSVLLNSIFSSAVAFNQPLNLWNTIAVTDMSNTFASAALFNQNINSWNTSNVSTFSQMFYQCSAFNQPLNSWNTGSVTNMASVFFGASSFNQNVGAWNVSNVTNFLQTFSGATAFNNGGVSDINNWTLKTTGTISMQSMFINATNFNQPLNLWNTVAVTNMNSMFQSAAAFNQNIGSWNVSAVTSFTNFMNSKTAANFSTTNLDAIYNGWSSRAVKPSIVITFGTIKYTSASSAGRAILTGSPNLWTITDGGI